MRTSLTRRLLGGVLMVLLVSGVAGAQTPTDPMAGLSEIRVEIAPGCGGPDGASPDLARALRRPDVVPDAIQTQIELEIRRSTSLRIVSNSATTLRVSCSVTDMSEGKFKGMVMDTTLSLRDVVRIVRNGVLLDTMVWESDHIMSWGGPVDIVIAKRPSTVDLLLKEFLNEYLAANPRK